MLMTEVGCPSAAATGADSALTMTPAWVTGPSNAIAETAAAINPYRMKRLLIIVKSSLAGK
ncbi:hypothetical protein GCM10010452_40030 [Crossiella cryophila]